MPKPIQIPNITVPLDEHCLSVNVDIEVDVDVAENAHSDDRNPPYQNYYRVHNINWVQHLLLGKNGALVDILGAPKHYLDDLEALVLAEIKHTELDTLKNM